MKKDDNNNKITVNDIIKHLHELIDAEDYEAVKEYWEESKPILRIGLKADVFARIEAKFENTLKLLMQLD